MKNLLSSAAFLAFSTAAQAQSVIFGAGYADYSDSSSIDQAIFSLEYQHRPFHDATRFSAALGAALSVDEDGNTHIGAGVIGIYSFADRWFVEGSVMPGFYSEANELNDLGGSFEIRSLFGLGYTLNNGNDISLAVTHKSNASTQEENPGVNALLLRYHLNF
ncbi:acyloxyacyl hydrolase [Ruegeria arenilitoris]|uniref:acyloxyacyl hydrolase n=1 Tax=Ruegeria arenilitoris TaxID=1173585 RepID=UPI00147F58A8|nr:acyloxyacyl hydrolase [Ruegeria arenilitoris]